MLVRAIALAICSIEDSRFEDFPTYAENAALLRAMNPDLDYWLWTDADVEPLIETRYPHLLGFVARFPHRFYLVDFARYLILDTYGGIYVDLDERPLRSLPADLGVVIGNCEYKGNRRLAGEYPANNNIVKLLPASYPFLIAYAQQEFERVSRMAWMSTESARGAPSSSPLAFSCSRASAGSTACAHRCPHTSTSTIRMGAPGSAS